MSLNCKQGDLVVMVRSSNGNEGKVFTVLRFIGAVDGFDGSDYWETDLELPTRLGGSFAVARDSYLRPIRPSNGQDETLSWIDVPNKEFA